MSLEVPEEKMGIRTEVSEVSIFSELGFITWEKFLCHCNGIIIKKSINCQQINCKYIYIVINNYALEDIHLNSIRLQAFSCSFFIVSKIIAREQCANFIKK
jgi:hypothetical protein